MAKYLENYKELIEIVEKLLSPEGCPWDREQTHESLKNYLIEEAYELVEAIENNDFDTMEEELGDVLFHVVLHSVIAEKNNKFNLETVSKKIAEKMIRRHPHVFGSSTVANVDEVWENWDRIKRKEKNNDKSLLASVPKKLPALLRAEKLQKRAARVGFDWEEVSEVWEKVYEEIEELKKAQAKADKEHMAEEVGDLLFSIVNLSRKLDIDPEDALQSANKKFLYRFTHVEDQARKKKIEISKIPSLELNKFWEKAKLSDKKGKNKTKPDK